MTSHDMSRALFERVADTRGLLEGAVARPYSALGELGQVWRDAEAQLVELRQPAALGALPLREFGSCREK